jgi:hypothetical protein
MPATDMPIPGENFTSDTRSYPWHQPPKYTTLTPALDYLSKKLSDTATAKQLVSFVETKLPLYKISQIIIMEGMANGKWTLDLGLLMAGPVTKLIEIVCSVYGVEYDLGIEEDDDEPTGMFIWELNRMQARSNDRRLFRKMEAEMPEIVDAAEEGAPVEPGAAGEAGGSEETEGLGEVGFTKMQGEESVPDETAEAVKEEETE